MFPISKLTSQGVRLMKRGCLRRTRIHLALWVLGIVLAGTLLVTPAAGAVAQPFSDIPKGAWYGEAVAALSERGVLFPDENGAFRPDAVNWPFISIASSVYGVRPLCRSSM